MKNSLIYLLLLFAVSGCVSQKNPAGFEKVIFHTTLCFGACPVYHLQVDKSKNIQLFAEKVYDKGKGFGKADSSKMGYFTGIVSDTTFAKLIKVVRTAVADTTSWNKADCCDGSTKTIIIYYNGKRKYLKAMFPPDSANELIKTLYEVCTDSKLQRTDRKFEIEK